MFAFIDNTPLTMFVLFALTLGLAPFMPEPHIVEKVRMLFAGQLVRPIDIFDFLFHFTPWALLAVKLYRTYFVSAG